MNPETLLANLDSGFFEANDQTLEYLQKALTAGSGVDAGSFTGGRALIPESLDQTLVNILHTQEDAVLFQLLKKKPVRSPVHQWDDRTEVGADDGAWVPEGGDSEESDQTISRKYVTAKYLQTLRKVTLQMMSSNTIEDAEALEQQAGTLWLIRNVERGLFDGDSALNANEPDGLVKLIPTTNIIDLRGKDATSAEFEAAMNNATRLVRESYGRISHFLSSTYVMMDVQDLLRDRIRFGSGDGLEGTGVFDKYPTPFGKFSLKEDIFIQEGAAPSASSLTAKRPSTPTLNSVTPGAHATSEFVAADAGDYYYTVVAVNRYGDSVAATASSAAAVSTGDRVAINVTAGGTAGDYYKVYRSQKDGVNTDMRYAFKVVSAGGTEDLYDTNSDLPGCSNAFQLTMDPMYDAIEWAQFLPMMKFPLYPTNAAVYPFLMLLFGALALKKGVQHIRLKNVAPSNLGWF